LAESRAVHEKTSEELATTQGELATTQAELESTKEAVVGLKAQLAALQVSDALRYFEGSCEMKIGCLEPNPTTPTL